MFSFMTNYKDILITNTNKQWLFIYRNGPSKRPSAYKFPGTVSPGANSGLALI